MKNLIKAFEIFLKYGEKSFPTNCSHDVLWVDVDPEKVSKADKETLQDLGFESGEDSDEFSEGFYSFHYGSC